MFTARISLASFLYLCYLNLLIAVRNVPSVATTPIIFGPVAFFVYGDCEVSLMRLWRQPTPPGQPQQLHPTPLQQQMPFPTDAASHPHIIRKAISTAWRIQAKCRPEMGYTFLEHSPMVYIDSAALFGIHFMRAFRGSEDLIGEGWSPSGHGGMHTYHVYRAPERSSPRGDSSPLSSLPSAPSSPRPWMAIGAPS